MLAGMTSAARRITELYCAYSKLTQFPAAIAHGSAMAKTAPEHEV